MQLMGNASEFQRAVQLLCATVSFDRNVTVQVFETSIRYRACNLRASHFVPPGRPATAFSQSDRRPAFGTPARHRRAPASRPAAPARLRGRAALSRARAREPPAARLLLALRHTLSSRMCCRRHLRKLCTSTFIRSCIVPVQVHLRDGVRLDAEQVNQTCTAGAGSLLLEFGLLSRLVRDPTYEAAPARVVRRLLQLRSNATGVYHSNYNMFGDTFFIC